MSLVGHNEAVAAFRAAALDDRLHHAWLLAGPEGVGKARFAEAAALWLLARAAGPEPASERLDVAEEHRIARLFAAGSHPDYRALRRDYDEKAEKFARSIRTEAVRSLQHMLAMAPSLSPRRVIVIDAIEELEVNAANALLKNLEEPPAGTIFLLVSHAPGRLLPTIRSRCRLLRFGRLDERDTATVLARALPEERDIATLARIAEGAPGSAIHFAGLDVAGLDAAIERLARDGDRSNGARALLARTLGAKAAQPRYEAFLERVPRRIARAAREGGPAMAGRVALWAQARAIAERAVAQSMDPQVTVFELAGLLASLAPDPGSAKG